MKPVFQQTTEGMDVRYVAQLARLDLTADEIRLFQDQLSAILRYVEELKGVSVDGVEPTAHAVGVTNVFRADEPRPTLPREQALANAPQVRHEQFVVPTIIE